MRVLKGRLKGSLWVILLVVTLLGSLGTAGILLADDDHSKGKDQEDHKGNQRPPQVLPQGFESIDSLEKDAEKSAEKGNLYSAWIVESSRFGGVRCGCGGARAPAQGAPDLRRAGRPAGALAHAVPGPLLTAGIYSRIRHPRYLEVVVLTLAYALFANHVGSYVLWLMLWPTLLLVVRLEERELAERFGAAWEEYARRVPLFLPRRREGVAPRA